MDDVDMPGYTLEFRLLRRKVYMQIGQFGVDYRQWIDSQPTFEERQAALSLVDTHHVSVSGSIIGGQWATRTPHLGRPAYEL